MAEERGARIPRLPCRARQPRRGQDIWRPGRALLAPGAPAPEPEGEHDLGANGASFGPMAAETPRAAPLPREAIRRSPPKAGAQCGNPARWDLRGGPPVRVVPTAIPRQGHARVTDTTCGQPLSTTALVAGGPSERVGSRPTPHSKLTIRPRGREDEPC